MPFSIYYPTLQNWYVSHEPFKLVPINCCHVFTILLVAELLVQIYFTYLVVVVVVSGTGLLIMPCCVFN